MKSVIRITATIFLLALMVVSPVIAAPSGVTTAATATSPAPSSQLPTTPPYVSPTAGVSPNADGTTAFTLAELGMTVNIPNDLYVFTRDITAENTNPAVFGLTSSDFTNYLQTNGIYLNAIAEQVSYEINISMMSTPDVQAISDFNRLSDAELKAFMQGQTVIYQMKGYQYGTPALYTGNKSAKFIGSDITGDNANGNKTYGIQYFTIHDGKAIIIDLTTYSPEMVAKLTPMLTMLLDTATFLKNTVLQPSPSAAASSGASTGAGNSQASASASKPSASVQPSAGAQPSANVQPGAGAVPSAGLLGFLGDNKYVQYGAILLTTFILMTVPMLIYRFAVRKEPLKRSRGALAAGIDGLVFAALGAAYYLFLKGSLAFLVCAVFWSVVNFFILIIDKERETKETERPKGLYPIILAEEAEKKQTAQSSNMTVNKTCKNCFAVNLATSNVCFYCGAKLEDDEENKDATNL